MPRLTEEQHAERALGLGASDIATAAGVNPWQTPYELYLEKRGELDPEAARSDQLRDAAERGHRLEDVALEWDRDETGDPFVRVRRTIWHPTIPFMYAHPDAARDRRLRRLIEVKTSKWAWHELPRRVEVQAHAQLAVTRAEGVDVLVQTFDGPPKRWPVERDEQWIAAIEGLAIAFWNRVQAGDPPPMDGSRAVSGWLDRTRFAAGPELVADPLQADLLRRLLEVRDQTASLEEEDAKLVNMLKDTMAGSSRLRALGLGRVNWIAPHDVERVAWKEVASAYRTIIEEAGRLPAASLRGDDAGPAFDLDAIQSLYTTEHQQRQFRVSDEREDTR